jgi:hypothetical protein
LVDDLSRLTGKLILAPGQPSKLIPPHFLLAVFSDDLRECPPDRQGSWLSGDPQFGRDFYWPPAGIPKTKAANRLMKIKTDFMVSVSSQSGWGPTVPMLDNAADFTGANICSSVLTPRDSLALPFLATDCRRNFSCAAHAMATNATRDPMPE